MVLSQIHGGSQYSHFPIKKVMPSVFCLSKIEAELEAELARLELNITSKCLEEEISDFNEVMIFHRNTPHTPEVVYNSIY